MVTVGPQDVDIVGTDQRALQAAVDQVARLGGGSVKVLPGTYRLRNAAYLQSHVHLRGAGVDPVVIKEPSVGTPLAGDRDWYDQEVTLQNADGFRLGDGISWQVCHDVTVEDCVSKNHSGLGLHPGSGSQRPVMRNNALRGNAIGLFFCWGVKHGEGAPVIDIQGPTRSITISDNEFSDSRGGKLRLAVKMGPETSDIIIEGSRISGSVASP